METLSIPQEFHNSMRKAMASSTAEGKMSFYCERLLHVQWYPTKCWLWILTTEYEKVQFCFRWTNVIHRTQQTGHKYVMAWRGQVQIMMPEEILFNWSYHLYNSKADTTNVLYFKWTIFIQCLYAFLPILSGFLSGRINK